MSDLENMPENTEDTTQPVDVVATDTEAAEAVPPADDTETEEFVIEGEGDDETPKEDEEELKRRAAFAKAKQKKREAQEAAKAEREKREAIEAELAELKAWAADMRRGPKPDPMNYTSSEDFYADLEKWNGKPQEQNPQPAAQPQQSAEPDYEVEYALEEGQKALEKGGISDYQQQRENFDSVVAGAGIQNPEAVYNHLASIAHTAGVDVGKAMYMASRNASKLISEINSLKGNDLQIQLKISKILEREAGKLKTRQKPKIDTVPEEAINGGGVKKGIDMSQYGHFEN